MERDPYSLKYHIFVKIRRNNGERSIQPQISYFRFEIRRSNVQRSRQPLRDHSLHILFTVAVVYFSNT